MTPVHVIAGFLGTGKTTLLQSLLPRLSGRSAVIVNDFGQARIDATLLDGAATLTDIPGGCVCCTAPEGLGRAVEALLDSVKPDRIFIEPSGLARPQDVVDMLARGGVGLRVALQPTVVLVDVAQVRPGEPGLGLTGEVLAQIEAADVLVGSRADLADTEQHAAFHAFAAQVWPPLLAVATAARGAIDPAFVVGPWPEMRQKILTNAPHDETQPHHDEARSRNDETKSRCDDPHHEHTLACVPRRHPYAAVSEVWPAEAIFAWEKLRVVLQNAPSLARFKGLVHTDIGWVRIDVAGGRLHVAPTGYRRDSRVDAIVEDPDATGIEAARLREHLHTALAPMAPALIDGALVLVDEGDRILALDRRALAGLPGQVPDVSVVQPGRVGSAVPLAEVLALAAPSPDARFVLVASDGMTTAPLDVREAAGALVVHSLDGAELPAGQGGPFRVLVPAGTGEEKPTCASVKGLVRVRLLPG
jgi:G3E family GTPase